MTEYEKAFEKQRDKMDDILADTFDLGQMNALRCIRDEFDKRNIDWRNDDCREMYNLVNNMIRRFEQIRGQSE